MRWKFLTMIWPRDDDLDALVKSRAAECSAQETSVLYLTPDQNGVMIESMNAYAEGVETPVQMGAFHCRHGQRIQVIGRIESIALKEKSHETG